VQFREMEPTTFRDYSEVTDRHSLGLAEAVVGLRNSTRSCERRLDLGSFPSASRFVENDLRLNPRWSARRRRRAPEARILLRV
jgi:hypothetical protein